MSSIKRNDDFDTVEISVIRSADGEKCQFSLSLSSTLNALKDAIDSNGVFGPLKRDQQRLFHLGRELKSGNRSLKALGLGKHGVFSVHLHSLAPKTVDLQSDGDESDGVNMEKKHGDVFHSRNICRQSGNKDDGEDDDIIDVTDSSANKGAASNTQQLSQGGTEHLNKGHSNNSNARRNRRRQNQQGGVVELLESDTDDDARDVVEVVENVDRHKRRRRN